MFFHGMLHCRWLVYAKLSVGVSNRTLASYNIGVVAGLVLPLITDPRARMSVAVRDADT